MYNSPKALLFKGTEGLNGKDVGDVMKASLGNTVSGDANWSGLTIVDPFEIPKRTVAVYIDGTDDIHTNDKVKSYPIRGDVEDAINVWSTDLKFSNSDVADIDLNQIDEAVSLRVITSFFFYSYLFKILSYKNMFSETPNLEIAMKSNKNLKPELHSEDKEFLQIKELFSNIALKYQVENNRKSLMILRASLLPIAKAHGEKSAAMTEARKLIAESINNLFETIKHSDGKVFLVAIAAKNEVGRSKRAVEPPQQSGVSIDTISTAFFLCCFSFRKIP